jgi:hypothetical protein
MFIDYKYFWDVTELEWSCVVGSTFGMAGKDIITFKETPSLPDIWCLKLSRYIF